jgi:hypothetical protein
MNPRWNKATPDAILEGNKAKPNASIWGAGAGSQASSLHFRSKDKNVLDIPSYRSGVYINYTAEPKAVEGSSV